MSGQELLDRIVRELLREKVPPLDSAIVNKLRQVSDVQNWWATRYSNTSE